MHLVGRERERRRQTGTQEMDTMLMEERPFTVTLCLLDNLSCSVSPAASQHTCNYVCQGIEPMLCVFWLPNFAPEGVWIWVCGHWIHCPSSAFWCFKGACYLHRPFFFPQLCLLSHVSDGEHLHYLEFLVPRWPSSPAVSFDPCVCCVLWLIS